MVDFGISRDGAAQVSHEAEPEIRPWRPLGAFQGCRECQETPAAAGRAVEGSEALVVAKDKLLILRLHEARAGSAPDNSLQHRWRYRDRTIANVRPLLPTLRQGFGDLLAIKKKPSEEG
jgi:hypothetical protein